MDTKKLIEAKRQKKSRNPKFIRQDTHKKKRLDKIWRKPRGIDSKQRLMKNYRVIVKPGYGTPRILRGADKEGKKIIFVSSMKDIESLDPKKHVAVVSGKIGLRAKKLIMEELGKKKIAVQNIKNPAEYIEKKQKRLEDRKKKKEERQKKKEKKKEAVAKKESIEDKVSDEEKKKLEKKEIDRLLTKKF